MRPIRAIWTLASLLAAGALASCGDDPAQPPARSPAQPNPTTPREPAGDQADGDPARALRPPPCPPGLTNCRRATGTILYVERVDPDGDGDAHFVLLSGDSITAPGITVVDVRRDLRPQPLPGVGAQLAAAGPVYPGSRGQRQIESVAVRVAP